MGKLIHDSDFAFFKSVTAEVNELAGEMIGYYLLDKEAMSNYDPIYNEQAKKSDYKFKQPFQIPVSYEHPDSDWMATERGREKQKIGAQLYIAVIHWDHEVSDRAPYPGDVVQFREQYWDITAVSEDGWLDTSHTQHTMYRLTLSWLSRNIPDEKINCE